MVHLILNEILKPLSACCDVLRAILFKIIGLARTQFEFETPTLY